MKKRIPAEVVASVLAATTVILSLPPTNLPPWAIFISWAGTFAAGGPNKETLRKIWPVMPLGSFTAMIIVLCFRWTAPYFPGNSVIVSHMAIIFVLNASMMLLGRTKLFRFVPGMFFGFASFFATFFGGWGPIAHNPFSAFAAVVIMNFLGPVYAWLNVKLEFPVAEEPKPLTKAANN